MKLYQILNSKLALLLLFFSLVNMAANSQRLLKSESEIARGMQKAMTSFTTNPDFTISRGFDTKGCYYDITFKPVWSVSGAPSSGLCNVNLLPAGFNVEFTGTTISSVSYSSSPWSTTAPLPTQMPASVSGSSYVYWNKAPIGNCWSTGSATNSIPSNQTQSVRIRVNPATAPVVNVAVRELKGDSWPPGWISPGPLGWNNSPFAQYWDLGMDTTFTNSCNYSIGPDMSVCSGTATIFSISPVPASPATVTWYKYTPPNASAACPSTNPFSPLWQVDQTGGPTYNTNAITSTTCYVAVVNNGCNSCISNVKRVTVCPGVPFASITPNGSSALQNINGALHACLNWSGVLSIPAASAFPCPTTIVRWEKSVNGGAWQMVPGSVNQNQISTNQLNVAAGSCNQSYNYRVVLNNACGTSFPSILIVIDNIANGGIIKTLTGQVYDVGTGNSAAPVICNGTGTRLVHSTPCGKIQYWEYRDEIAPCSGNYPAAWLNAGAGASNTWWTGLLTRTRQYRAYVSNGSCTGSNGNFSSVITVKVKPPLAVSINTSSFLLCANPTLTAVIGGGSSCNYPAITYQWFLNGDPVPGATQNTYKPLSHGNYSVTINGGCGTAKATPVPICQPVVDVTGPCCICLAPHVAEQVTLKTVITYLKTACGPPPVYLWSTGATTPTINISSPGIYTVTVKIGTCTFTKSIKVVACL